MTRDDRFVLSRNQFAVDLDSLNLTERHRRDGTSYWYGSVRAVWYRRRKGVTAANIGFLWDLQDDRPTDTLEFLARHDDGRYGGNCHGRWNGVGYWGSEDLNVQAEHLAVLRPMLERYPESPRGFDGWWRFDG